MSHNKTEVILSRHEPLPDKSFTAYWLSGNITYLVGPDVSRALMAAGFNPLSVCKIAFIEYTEHPDRWEWDGIENVWVRKTNTK